MNKETELAQRIEQWQKDWDYTPGPETEAEFLAARVLVWEEERLQELREAVVQAVLDGWKVTEDETSDLLGGTNCYSVAVEAVDSVLRRLVSGADTHE